MPEASRGQPVRWSIRTKTFLGFSAIIFVFGAVGIYGLLQMREIGRLGRLVRLAVINVEAEVRNLRAQLGSYEEQLDSASADRLIPFVRKAKPYEKAGRIRESVATLRDDFRLESTERLFVDKLHASLSEAMDGTGFRMSLETSVDPTVRRVLQEAPEARSNQNLYAALAHSLVLNLQARKTEESAALRGEIISIVRALAPELQASVRGTKEFVKSIETRSASAAGQSQIAIAVASGFALILALSVMVWIGLTLRPIQDLREGVRRFAQGDFKAVRVQTNDEIGQLASDFNSMAISLGERDRLLATQREELLKSERLATIGKMSSQITHEIRNPLSSIGLNSELLEDEIADLAVNCAPDAAEEALGLLKAIRGEVDRLTAVTEQYLRFARLPRPSLSESDLNDLCKTVIAFMRFELESKGVVVDVNLAPSLTAFAFDHNQIRQSLLNLIRNAIEAMEPTGGGAIVVTTTATAACARLSVADDGPGIDAETLERIFDPFFSTKETGTGLGLALVQQIAQEHGGHVECETAPDQGTTITIVLPRDSL